MYASTWALLVIIYPIVRAKIFRRLLLVTTSRSSSWCSSFSCQLISDGPALYLCLPHSLSSLPLSLSLSLYLSAYVSIDYLCVFLFLSFSLSLSLLVYPSLSLSLFFFVLSLSFTLSLSLSLYLSLYLSLFSAMRLSCSNGSPKQECPRLIDAYLFLRSALGSGSHWPREESFRASYS